MSRLLTTIATATILIAGTTLAQAQWSRNGSATGPGGRSITSQGGGSCAGGTCNFGGTTTGPQGRSATRSGSVTRTAPGQFQSNGTYTGPGGRSATRSGSFTRN
ncbi:hypothetical protein [Rhabdaerophilum sp. SD176]|uniref:hypothetical protein n=1 Tax=Rhabdaerophilum sp. SD176 TaxID=2983548 RepID=UPI0024E0296F|nr:hypothetical protein [Rhabdaerophilum sp. SD176]